MVRFGFSTNQRARPTTRWTEAAVVRLLSSIMGSRLLLLAPPGQLLCYAAVTHTTQAWIRIVDFLRVVVLFLRAGNAGESRRWQSSGIYNLVGHGKILDDFYHRIPQ